ncbi:hypothetical protein ACDA63_19435 [Uliginosibacterium sp. sgz301328]|uniref:hypothetical protein n=1 Tax=Uliginosibacterium sp. sgz301328 TaxID=3243764 RepID=UPI00359F0DD4
MHNAARLRWLLALPAVVSLVCGVMSGLARLGWVMPLWVIQLIVVHGALMVGGFFGTLIGLERAVALARPWPYVAPLASGVGGLALVAHATAVGIALMTAGSLAMTLACASVWRRERAAHLATLCAGALAWLAGNGVWWATGSVAAATPLWAAFLILTIAGERLELSRLVPTSPAARRTFFGIVVLLASTGLAAAVSALGLRAFAATLALLAIWLLRHDIARRTVRTPGLTRFMAVCLLSGYAWLLVAAALGVAGAFDNGAVLRDAALHSLLLGFVFSMVFGHAPVIVPALTRLRFAWRPVFYLPLALLHATLIVRVGAGLGGDYGWRHWGGVGNTIALIVFALLVATAVRRPQRRPSAA